MEQPPRKAKLPEHLLEFARSLRQSSTEPEDRLWMLLRNRRFLNLKFRQQHPASTYLLDFYCDELKWAIELDGGQHNSAEGRQADAERTAELTQLGITVTRFWNHDVLKDLENVLEAMFHTAQRLRGD